MEGTMKDLFVPAGRVALVTGGTSGLGHAIAEAFLQNGVDVAVCSRHPESAPDLAGLAAAEGRRYLPVRCDITDEADVAALGEKQFGRPLCRACYKLAMDTAKAQNGGDAHDPSPQAPAAQG